MICVYQVIISIISELVIIMMISVITMQQYDWLSSPVLHWLATPAQLTGGGVPVYNGKVHYCWPANNLHKLPIILLFGKTFFCQYLPQNTNNLKCVKSTMLYLSFIFQIGRGQCWPPKFPLCRVRPGLVGPPSPPPCTGIDHVDLHINIYII